ncbi:sulfotransferase domain-containing protein [Alicyclobacillus fastidiosus]|uniref:Sulfotransferase domain-containing protein n=1 Tax=Alicyclobacillus fastidiosus TaxID=392011 RepID=A0ABV5AKN2_9BACL|nr:sulfotransferase domain-containing protein [Alicyclobacillus fastidiosus]WEH11035.1 sulfotransferase domain-containing protein [Alicyclobacillus fastidiosus]
MQHNGQCDRLPPFIMSSVPKSGTHLLHQILNGMPNVSNDIGNADKKFFVDHPVQHVDTFKDHFYRLAQLQPNEFGLGHMFYSEQYAYMLRRLHLKHVFIYRDPRDVLVSLSYFIPDHWGEHPLYDDFKRRTTNQRDRILKLIHGVPGIWPDFTAWNRPFYQWKADPNTLSITFEDLMRSSASRRETIMSIVHYLWDGLKPPVPYEEMVNLMEASIDPQHSNTFRKGEIGSWRQELDGSLVQDFKRVAGDLLIESGYERDYDW